LPLEEHPFVLTVLRDMRTQAFLASVRSNAGLTQQARTPEGGFMVSQTFWVPPSVRMYDPADLETVVLSGLTAIENVSNPSLRYEWRPRRYFPGCVGAYIEVALPPALN
jgi:hypothetical protein